MNVSYCKTDFIWQQYIMIFCSETNLFTYIVYAYNYVPLSLLAATVMWVSMFYYCAYSLIVKPKKRSTNFIIIFELQLRFANNFTNKVIYI